MSVTIPSDAAGPLPLSPLQGAMLRHLGSAPPSGVDIQQVVCTLSTRVDEQVLAAAWRIITERHPVLRGFIRWDVAAARIEIARRARPAIALHGFGHLDREGRAELFETFLRMDRKRPFDLDQAPLFRLSFFEMGEDGSRFVLSFHRFLMDGRSTATVLRDVMEVYDALRAGSVPELRPLAPSRPRFRGARAAEVERFWRTRLTGFGDPTPLPGEGSGRPALADRSGRFADLVKRVDPDVRDRLGTAARRHGFSIESAVHAAWTLLLARCGALDEVVYGATLAPRRERDEEGAMGLRINSVPMRVRIRGETKVGHWLGQIGRALRASRSHLDVSLAECTAWSEVAPTRPLFETLLVFDHHDIGEHLRRSDPAWAARDVRMLEWTQLPLTVFVVAGPELTVRLAYDRCRISHAAARGLADRLLLTVARLAEAPDDRVRDL